MMLFGAMMTSFTACEKNPVEENGNGNGGGSQTEEPDFNPNGHEYVDLGLPSGTLWATCNVGASAPEEYGDKFAWGEITIVKNDYDWSEYKHGVYNEDDTTNYGMIKYNNIDGKTILDPEDDAATQIWGGSWRMPTKQEMRELCTECKWNPTTKNETVGYDVVGINGNSIFLPKVNCWTSDIGFSLRAAYMLFFYHDEDDPYMATAIRISPFRIRPVLSSAK